MASAAHRSSVPDSESSDRRPALMLGHPKLTASTSYPTPRAINDRQLKQAVVYGFVVAVV
jgi:hypothetical protein